MISPQTWRIVADRVDAPDCFIPLAPGPRSRAVLQRMIDGPTEEERMGIKREMEKQEVERVATMLRLRVRHEELVQFADSPVVTSLLQQHAPREVEGLVGKWYQECHGCPQYYDHDEFGDGSEQYHAWPCPTWQTISGATH